MGTQNQSWKKIIRIIPDFLYFQVAGPYLQQYDVYYKRLDPEGKDEIPAMAAAGFLKKSGLADDILGKVRLMPLIII